jgi:dihydrofolate reductase
MSEEGAAVRRVDDTAKSEGDIEMGKVMTGGTMSLDGYIAGPEESGFDLLFQWYGNGDVEIPSASPDVPPPRISAASAELIKSEWEETGALVVGRHLYDMTNAWGGRHQMNVTTVVLTHRRPDDRPEDDENFIFVTEGIEGAVAKAKELAGDKSVAVNGAVQVLSAAIAPVLDRVTCPVRSSAQVATSAEARMIRRQKASV